LLGIFADIMTWSCPFFLFFPALDEQKWLETGCRRWLPRQKSRLGRRCSSYLLAGIRGYEAGRTTRRRNLADISDKKAFRMRLALGSVIASMI
jgi:hypothetical protein